MDLNQIMEFDHVIVVNADGTVTDAPADVYAPEDLDYPETEGKDWKGGSWTLMDGYSGQYGYSGPWMHSSEFIGGRIAQDILATPGTYVAIADIHGNSWAVAVKTEGI